MGQEWNNRKLMKTGWGRGQLVGALNRLRLIEALREKVYNKLN
jgi:hypothetical protein